MFIRYLFWHSRLFIEIIVNKLPNFNLFFQHFRSLSNFFSAKTGKALTCNYHRGVNYLEIDVDIGSSAIANAVLHLALRYVTSVTIDMGFVVEAQTEDELPERLIGAVRVSQMQMSSATSVESSTLPDSKKLGLSKVNHHHQSRIQAAESGDDDEDN